MRWRLGAAALRSSRQHPSECDWSSQLGALKSILLVPILVVLLLFGSADANQTRVDFVLVRDPFFEQTAEELRGKVERRSDRLRRPLHGAGSAERDFGLRRGHSTALTPSLPHP